MERKDLTFANAGSMTVSAAFTLKNVGQVKDNQIILDNINLEIAAEKLTALVGPSGAGKLLC